MDVLLKPELERFVAEKIKAGAFADASDMVNEALEVMKEQEELTPQHEEYLRREARRGIEQLDQGKCSELDIRKIITEEHARFAGRNGK